MRLSGDARDFFVAAVKTKHKERQKNQREPLQLQLIGQITTENPRLKLTSDKQSARLYLVLVDMYRAQIGVEEQLRRL